MNKSAPLSGINYAVRTSCANGHPLPPVLPSVVRGGPWYRPKSGARVCLECHRDHQHTYMARMQAAYRQAKEEFAI